jgi:hypothetical protein
MDRASIIQEEFHLLRHNAIISQKIILFVTTAVRVPNPEILNNLNPLLI